MTSPKKSLRRFSKEFARKNLVSPAKSKKVPMDLAPSDVHAPSASTSAVPSQKKGGNEVPKKRARPADVMRATYREPSPAEVYPNEAALTEMMADVDHLDKIDEYNRAKNREVVAAFEALPQPSAPQRDVDSGASPNAVARSSGQPVVTSSSMLASLVSSGMSTGRK